MELREMYSVQTTPKCCPGQGKLVEIKPMFWDCKTEPSFWGLQWWVIPTFGGNGAEGYPFAEGNETLFVFLWWTENNSMQNRIVQLNCQVVRGSMIRTKFKYLHKIDWMHETLFCRQRMQIQLWWNHKNMVEYLFLLQGWWCLLINNSKSVNNYSTALSF